MTHHRLRYLRQAMKRRRVEVALRRMADQLERYTEATRDITLDDLDAQIRALAAMTQVPSHLYWPATDPRIPQEPLP